LTPSNYLTRLNYAQNYNDGLPGRENIFFIDFAVLAQYRYVRVRLMKRRRSTACSAL